VEEAVLIKEWVKHAGIDFLFLHYIWLLKLLHGFNQLSNPLVNLRGLSIEDVLEVVICSRVYFFRVLGRSNLFGEEDGVLLDKVSHHALATVRQHECVRVVMRVIEVTWVLKVLHCHAKPLLVQVRTLKNCFFKRLKFFDVFWQQLSLSHICEFGQGVTILCVQFSGWC